MHEHLSPHINAQGQWQGSNSVLYPVLSCDALPGKHHACAACLECLARAMLGSHKYKEVEQPF